MHSVEGKPANARIRPVDHAGAARPRLRHRQGTTSSVRERGAARVRSAVGARRRAGGDAAWTLRGGGAARRALVATAATDGALGDLSSGELKRLLTERGVDFRDCIEKRELVERLRESVARGDAAGGGGGGAAAGLTESEAGVVALFQRCSPSVANIQTSVLRRESPLSLNAVEVPRGTGSGLRVGRGRARRHELPRDQGRGDGQDLPARARGRARRAARRRRAREGPRGAQGRRTFPLLSERSLSDLAVLKVDAPKSALRPLYALGSSSALLVGQTCVAIGNPFGLDSTLTTGVVSALGREVQGVGGRPIKGCVQTDAAINPGNSGGPLLDSRGRLIGVNTAIFSPSGTSAGIGFAIPVDTVRRIVSQIIRYGRVQRPSLGVTVIDDQMLRNFARQLRRPLEGVLLADVPADSPPPRRGLRGCVRDVRGGIGLGDLVTAVGDTPVRSVEDLLSAVEELPAANPVARLTVRRGPSHEKTEMIGVRTVERGQLTRR